MVYASAARQRATRRGVPRGRPDSPVLLGLGSDLDLLARRLEALGAHLQIDASIIDRFQRIFERQVAVLQKLELLIQLLERLLVRELLGHVSTSSTLAPSRPAASRMRSRRLIAVPADERRTAPDSASCVML